ncbi:MAG: hypothetical protein HY914_20870 [Desulfomonile tiedjei]|nr:hypothetical protein [Desulfomonile tiedjei]
MDKRKIKGKDILRDIKAGVDDATLMHRYALSAPALHSVFSKLLAAKALTQAELDDRVPVSERTVDIGLFICPACGNIQAQEFTKCPRCGFSHPDPSKKVREAEAKLPETPSKVTIAKRSGSTKVMEVKSLSLTPTAVEPTAPDWSDEPAFPDLNRLVSQCRLLAIVSVICAVLVVVAMFVFMRLQAPQGGMTAFQLLLAVIALGIPVAVIAFIASLTLRALGQSIRLFVRLSRGAR